MTQLPTIRVDKNGHVIGLVLLPVKRRRVRVARNMTSRKPIAWRRRVLAKQVTQNSHAIAAEQRSRAEDSIKAAPPAPKAGEAP